MGFGTTAACRDDLLLLPSLRCNCQHFSKENVAKANKAKLIPLVFETRAGFGEVAVNFLRVGPRSIQIWEYNSHFQYYTKEVSVALARGSATNPCAGIEVSR
jgi:hypothetical protein